MSLLSFIVDVIVSDWSSLPTTLYQTYYTVPRRLRAEYYTVGGPIKGPIYFVILEVWSLNFIKSLNFLKNFVSVFSEFL